MMDRLMIAFLRRNKLLSLGVIDNDGVYGASCYYAFDEERLCLILKSDAKSRHIKLATINPKVSIIIAKDSKNLACIKGMQIKAILESASSDDSDIYYTRFPFARLGSGEIYRFRILWAKYTDNTLLKKLVFQDS